MFTSLKRLKTETRVVAFAVSFAVLILVGGAGLVHAENGQNSGSSSSNSGSDQVKPANQAELKQKQDQLEKERQARVEAEKAKVEARKAEVEAKKTEMEAKMEEHKAKLADNKLEVCKKHEAAINKNIQGTSDRRTKQLEFLNTVSERIQTFYTDKNLSLANYDALVADVNAKKAAAEQAIDTLKVTTVEFKCDGSDPKGVGEANKAARQPVIDALKAYKQSVKNLITGVKSVAPAKTESSEKQS